MTGGLALRNASRRLVALLHRWTGLALLAFLTVAAFTGSILAFPTAVETWLNPGFMRVAAGTTLAPLADVITRVEARFPDASVSSITLPATPRSSMSVYLQAKPVAGSSHVHTMGAPVADLEANQVFVDPYTGRIVGQRNTRRFALDTAVLVPFTLQLHHSLLMSQAGKTILGVCAIGWLLTSLLGMALAWPTGWSNPRAWRPMVSVRARQGVYLLNYDLHRAMSVLLLPVSLALAFSSVYLNLPGAVRPVVASLSPLAVEQTSLGAATCATPASADEALRAATLAVPGSKPYLIAREFSRGWYRVRLRQVDDIGVFGDSAAYINACDGSVASLKLAAAASAGDRFLNWQYPLHAGVAFGAVGQGAILLIGLALCAINVTGAVVWFHKWRQRRRHGRSQAMAAVPAPRPGTARAPDPAGVR